MPEEPYQKLAAEVTQLIIDVLNIKHVTADQVNYETPLFSEENVLDLDSVDTIEIVVELQKAYGVRITDEMPVQEILYSVKSITEFLLKQGVTEKIA